MEAHEVARAVLEAAGFSAAQVARQAGIDRTYIWRQFDGQYPLKPETVEALAELIRERLAAARAPAMIARAVLAGG